MGVKSSETIRTFHHREFDSAGQLLMLKRRQGISISIVIPARGEGGTLGVIVSTIDESLRRRTPLVDEIVVIDDRCEAVAAREAADNGARVVPFAEAGPPLDGSGKGASLWKSQFVTSGDLVVFIDADIANFTPHFILGLIGPLLHHPEIYFVKSFYRRPLRLDDRLYDNYGGRITEIMVRPLLCAFMPDLAQLRQPLSGEYALRREVMESLPFSSGYGVEIGLLFDFHAAHGVDHLAQVDIECRIHRNRTVAQLGRAASGIMRLMLKKLGERKSITINEPLHSHFAHPDGCAGDEVCEENIELQPKRLFQTRWNDG